MVEQHQTAMTFDQTPKNPITGPVNGYSDIIRIFNPITHNKAAAILRMIKYTVTENRFRIPLQLFLNKYKYDFYIFTMNKIQVHTRGCLSIDDNF